MIMNEKIKLAVAGALLLAACDVKDPIYNTSHPDHGTITLTTDWSGIGEGVQVPASYTVRVGDYSVSLSGTTNRIDNLFVPGTYRASVYNTPEHILVNDVTASVEAATTPEGQSGTFVNNAPGWLFACALDAAIEKDTDHTFAALMQQQVRQLTLIIEPTGGSTDRIDWIEGRLSGVASSLDFANDTHAAPANVELQFARIADGANAGKWSATVRLLGTAGGQQKLSAQIHFAGDSPSAVSLESDLTTELAAFNADKRTPLALGGRMVETPTGMGFDATIEQWEEVDPVEGDATLPEPEPARIGDFFYSDGSYSTELDPKKTVIGIVFQTDPARIGEAETEFLKAKGVAAPRGLVMALKNAGTNLTWGPAGWEEELPNCESPEQNNYDISGYGNCELIRQGGGNFDSYPAFKAAADYNATFPAPETTTGWYLPASGQWYDILHNLVGLADWDAAVDDSSDFYWADQGDVPTVLNAWMAEVAPEAKDEFSDDVWFWVSSEFSNENARLWSMESCGYVYCQWNAKSLNNAVRPVLAF